MNLSDLIKNYRRENKLSQRQFAAKCNLSNGFISMVENNANPKTQKPITLSIKSMKRISDGMGLTIDDLIENTEDVPIMLSDIYNEEMETELFRWLDNIDILGNDEISPKKRELIEAIKCLDDSDLDVIQAAADALIARRGQ